MGEHDIYQSCFTNFSLFPILFLFTYVTYGSYCNILVPLSYPLDLFFSPFETASTCLQRCSLPLLLHSCLAAAQLKRLHPVSSNYSNILQFWKLSTIKVSSHAFRFISLGDLPQVPGSEGLLAVVKHDGHIDCAEDCNSWLAEREHSMQWPRTQCGGVSKCGSLPRVIPLRIFA